MLKIYPRPVAGYLLRGDAKAMPNSEVPFQGDFDKSLPETDRGALKKGYTDKGSIRGATKSDEPDWA